MNRACSIEDCSRIEQLRRGWCSAHYVRWRLHGNPLGGGPERRRGQASCSLEGCERPHKARGWCDLHHRRWLEHGDPGPVELIREERDDTCTIEGCELPHLARGWCTSHYDRWQRHGDPLGSALMGPPPKDEAGNTYGRLTVVARAHVDQGINRTAMWTCQCACGATTVASGANLRKGGVQSCGCLARELSRERATKEVVGYSAAHYRVKREYGPASGHACIGCGDPAQEWGYDHTDPNELMEEVTFPDSGRAAVVPYSLNINCYVPACKSCHRTADKKFITTGTWPLASQAQAWRNHIPTNRTAGVIQI